MFMLRLVAIAAVLVTPCAAQANRAASGDSDCWTSDEIASAHIHHLQIKLMVDSLKCQDTIPATLQSYNDFVNTRRDSLVAHKHRVEAHFVRRDGGQLGMIASDDYNTKVGNTVSSPVIDVVQCERAGTMARLATAASDADLLVLADTIAPERAIRDCPDAAPVSDRPRAMIIPVWAKKTEPIPVFETATAPAPIVAAVPLTPVAPLSNPPAPIAMASTSATPVFAEAAQLTPASTLQVSPAPSRADAPTDPITALKAAIAALAQAAAALPSTPAVTPNQ